MKRNYWVMFWQICFEIHLSPCEYLLKNNSWKPNSDQTSLDVQKVYFPIFSEN